MLFLVTIALCSALASGATISDASEFELPEGVKTCYQDDPNLNECIKVAIQDMIPKLYKGNKQLGIPPLDPYAIPNSRFDYNNGGIQGSLALKGVKVYGGSRTEVRNVDTKITETGLTSEIETLTPRVYIEGGYKADVKINDIKMNPRGYFNVTMSNIRLLTKMAGDFEDINGVKYLRMTNIDFIPDIGDMKAFATGLLPDPQLNAIVLDFFNQYWPEMYKLLIPESKPHWEPLMVEALNQFLLTVPFETLIKKRAE